MLSLNWQLAKGFRNTLYPHKMTWDLWDSILEAILCSSVWTECSGVTVAVFLISSLSLPAVVSKGPVEV